MHLLNVRLSMTEKQKDILNQISKSGIVKINDISHHPKFTRGQVKMSIDTLSKIGMIGISGCSEFAFINS